MKLNRNMGHVALLAIIALIMAGAGHAEVGLHPGLPVAPRPGCWDSSSQAIGLGAYEPMIAPNWGVATMPAWYAAAHAVPEGWQPNTRFPRLVDIVAPVTAPSMPMQIPALPVPVPDAYRAVHQPWPARLVRVGPRPSTYPIGPPLQPSGPRPSVTPISRAEVQVLRALR